MLPVRMEVLLYMETLECDVIILGCGPAGYQAAMSCAVEGYATVVIERHEPGGTGYRWGCLPVKAMLDSVEGLRRAGELISAFRPEVGAYATGRFRYDILHTSFDRGREFSDSLPGRLDLAGVRYIHGEPTFTHPNCCTVDDVRIRGTYTVLATGTDPCLPGKEPVPGGCVRSHRELGELDTFPFSVIIVGGDVEGVELASFFSAVGTEVRIMEQAERLLPGLDEDLVAPVVQRLLAEGTLIFTSTQVKETTTSAGGASVTIGAGEVYTADVVLVTGSRRPNIPAGMGELGLETTEDGILVNERLETSLSGVYAVGDINGRLCMAHEAIRQGSSVPRLLKGEPCSPPDAGFPRAVFSLPEIAGVGLQESECRRKGIPYKPVIVPFTDIPRAAANGDRSGFIKVLFDENDRILGIWGSGRKIAETASGWVFMLGTAAVVENNLLIHPTLQGGVREAVFRIKGKHRPPDQQPPE